MRGMVEKRRALVFGEEAARSTEQFEHKISTNLKII